MDPNTSSPMLSFAFKYGTKPAHKAVYIPEIKNPPKAPRIVRLSKSTDLICATPATPTITGLIGLRNKPRLAPFCIPSIVVIGSRPR